MRSIFPALCRALCLSLLALVLTGCGTSPERAAEKFYKAVADNHVEEALSIFSFRDAKSDELTLVKGKLSMMIGEMYSTIQAKGGLDSVKASLVNQKDNAASVKVELKFRDGTRKEEVLNLINEGDWKIVLW